MAFTFFFRDRHTLEQLTSFLLQQIDSYAKIKVWDAGCAMGPEPYTFGIILCEAIGAEKYKKVSILATDIDKRALQAAEIGSYTERSLEKVPKENLSKYFTKEKNNYVIKDEIKKAVSFKVHNLLSDPYPNNCDLIICRNVLIYFTEEGKDIVYKKISDALKKGGILFVGSTEQIITPSKYGLSSLRTFFYVKS